MHRDNLLSLKHFGGISKVKSIFSLLVSAGNHGDELSCEESDELLQDPISFEVTSFFFHDSPSNIIFLSSVALWHHHCFPYVEMFHDRIP